MPYPGDEVKDRTALTCFCWGSEARQQLGFRLWTSGQTAHRQLFRCRFQDRSPEEIIDADDPALGPSKRAYALWHNDKIRNATIESLADSVRLLAALWTAAWEVGKGEEKIAEAELKEFSESELMKVYRGDKDFAPSMSLQEMVDSGNFEPPSASKPSKKPAPRTKKARDKKR